MRGFLFAAGLAALPFGYSPACADDFANARDLEITVAGFIPQHCAMGSIGDMDFGNLQRRGLGAQTRVAFDCNIPFIMTIQSENGALTNMAMPNGQGPYSGKLPYSLSVDLPLRRPAAQTISRSFDSRHLQGGGVISSNGAIATDGMMLSVELGRPSGEAGLLAGDYSETITITVSPN